MSQPGRALILDGMWSKSVAAVRSLGRRGIRITAGESTRWAAALFSRYCNRAWVYPSPWRSPDRFLEALVDELRKGGYEAVIPMETQTQLVLSRGRSALAPFVRIPLPEHETCERLNDKLHQLRLARQVGVPCPRTWVPASWEELHALAPKLPYPAVIKPRVSSGSRGVRYVRSARELLHRYGEVHAAFPWPMVQEYIPHGGAYGVGVLLNFRSQIRAAFVYRRLREYPVRGGPSTLRMSVRDPGLEATAVRLLQAAGWVGVAMVEFRVDARDGVPKLMEINPRFWGSLQLAILAGVDFPFLLYRMVREGDVEPVSGYREGVLCRSWIPGEILHLVHRPSALARVRRSHGDDLLSRDDPWPVVGRLLSAMALLWDRDFRRVVRR